MTTYQRLTGRVAICAFAACGGGVPIASVCVDVPSAVVELIMVILTEALNQLMGLGNVVSGELGRQPSILEEQTPQPT